MIIKVGVGNICWNFHNKTIVKFTLLQIALMWMSKDNFESKCRPTCFWGSAIKTGILLKNIWGWIVFVVFLLRITYWTCFVGSS